MASRGDADACPVKIRDFFYRVANPFWRRGLYDNPESRRGTFGGFLPWRFFRLPFLTGVQAEFEIGMKFMPAVRALHEHSPDICRDTKRLVTAVTVFYDVIFHRYCIGRGVATIK